MSAFLSHFTYEFKSGIRNRSMLFINYLFPLGFYTMMGLVMTAINPTFKAVMIPAMILFTIMASTLLGLPNPLVESRLAGIYRSYKINGVPAISIISIPMLTTVVHALIAATIVALTAGPLFQGDVPVNWLNLVLITTAGCLYLRFAGSVDRSGKQGCTCNGIMVAAYLPAFHADRRVDGSPGSTARIHSAFLDAAADHPGHAGLCRPGIRTADRVRPAYVDRCPVIKRPAGVFAGHLPVQLGYTEQHPAGKSPCWRCWCWRRP